MMEWWYCEMESLRTFPQHSLCVYELGCILSSAYFVPKTHFSFHFDFFYFRKKPYNFYSVEQSLLFS